MRGVKFCNLRFRHVLFTLPHLFKHLLGLSIGQ